MRKGTFSVQKAAANSSAHNSRTNPPKYLIELDYGTENYYELIRSDNDFIVEAQDIYKEKIKQKMQKKQVDNLIQETVLTLKKSQNENDVKNLFIKLKEKYGAHEILEISIHRDEGHFEKKGIAYYPTKNIIQKNNDWYICSDVDIEKPKKDDFDKLVNIEDFKKVYNYHAHVKFSMFDRGLGKSARMQKKDMSERIKFVSDELGLEFSPGENSQIKKSVNQIKDEHLATARAKERAIRNANKFIHEKTIPLAKANELKKEISELRAELQENKASRADYAELEQLSKTLKQKVKNKDLTIRELEREVTDLKEKLLTKPTVKYVENPINTNLQNELESLKASNVSNEKEKRAYTQSIRTLNSKNVSLEEEIEQFQQKLNIQAKKIIELKEENKNLTSLNEMKQKEVVTTKTIENPINKALEKENKELKASKNSLIRNFEIAIEKFVKVLDIPKVLKLSFFDSAVEKINSVLKQNKTLQEQNKGLNDKVIVLENKKPSELNINFSEDEIRVDFKDAKIFNASSNFAESVNIDELNEIEKSLKKDHDKNMIEELFKKHDTDEANDILNSYNDENERGLEL